MAAVALIGITLGLVCSIVSLPTNEELCNPELCKIWDGNAYQQEHNIGCNNDGRLGVNCTGNAKLIDLTKYVDLILHLHNSNRNEIANGNVNKYEPAVRMPTMKWSPTLQYMAEFNCKTCNYAHDKCRNTPEYPSAGQNIGETRSWPDPKPTKFIINKIFNDWFKEHKHADMTTISNFTGSNGGPSIGHFTQVVQDQAHELGCGLIKFKGKHNGKMAQMGYFVCNYAVGNMDSQPIYVSGPTAASCETGTNKNYKGLCSLKEKVKKT